MYVCTIVAGADCSQRSDRGSWESVTYKDLPPEGSASHCSIVWKDSLYVVGGESFRRSKMIYVYDYNGNVWETPHIEGRMPLPRYAHSCVLFGDKIFMYGGVVENSTVTNEIWAFDVSSKIWENVTVHDNCHNKTICGPLKRPRTPDRGRERPTPFRMLITRTGRIRNKEKCSEDRRNNCSGCPAAENARQRQGTPYFLGSSEQHGACLEIRSLTVRSAPENARQRQGTPYPLAGHTATRVSHGKKEKMVVIFGYSPQYGYLNTVQEYSLSTREWQIVKTSGFPVRGRYGHSSAYDPLTNLIYVYGGYMSESQSMHVLSSRLYSYHPNYCEWRLLTSAPSARFFHTATFVTSGLMLVFGGNVHNDTQQSHGARCYSADTLGYDVTCDTWHQYTMPKDMNDLPRYGHSATVFEKSMYIYGGFDGEMLSDMLRYTPGNCEHLTNQNQCLNARIGVKCVWHKRDNRCLQITKIPQHVLNHKEYDEHDGDYMKCNLDDKPPRGMTSHAELCKLFTDCVTCVQTSYNCVWCGKSCLHMSCRDNPNSPNSAITELEHCDQNTGIECLQLHTCHACSSNPRCIWSWSNGPDRCKPQSKTREVNVLNSTIQAQRLTMDPCRSPCAEYMSCRNCTESDCIWCQNEAKCVDKNAYPASFPYGQCREWTTIDARCRATETGREWCSFYSSCAACRSDPGCGWCDDGSDTGKGSCMSGGARGPSSKSSNKCLLEYWYFTKCPTCQCNGHSRCLPNTSECIQPCGNLTYGSHCDKCIPGFYGSPLNGATCQPCSCNNQGTLCTSETGKCYCTTKGIIGDHCERCDVSGLYHGDPTVTKGSCFYDLAIDYQFTFNLSKKEDRHYRAINFKNSPPKADIDAEFSITCSVLAKMNVSIKKVNSDEVKLVTNANCTTTMYKHRFSKADYNFGNEDNNTLTTFYVYVYDFQPPLWIQISFSQYSKLNLQQFFITFCTCFLALLLVAAILWKIKQKYDMYRRRQRLFLEMEQMASRAFSQVLVEIERRDVDNSDPERGDTDFTNCRKKKKNAPSPIALEPCCGNRAAVLSLLVRLPTGGESYTPAGQSAGLAVASALVTLGSPRRPSQELTTKEPKKTRKSASQHPDSTCI
ncbi:Putative protein tag-53 [Cyphomyrmex costatus]|uniref:Laminin EGF-like domain-containing protein n=1 Tax=Cyphomyrmex costatus TaxID=456900 RepID=A0A151IF75_9HYME|nr:Putative protein tag-53 [Cyphomyrmex costatus]